MKPSEYGVKTRVRRTFVLPVMALALVFFSFHKNPSEIRQDAAEIQNDDPFIVVLDAGHGGHDPGNLGNGYYEKNIALNIVLEAGRVLEKNSDIKVIYTRKDDTFVDLYVRGQIANEADADLFVSVHCDSHTSQAHGAGTFVLGLHANQQNFEIAKKENSVIYLEDNYKDRYSNYDINSPESIIGLTIMQEEFLDQSIALAKHMQDKFTKDLNRVDRKVKQAGFIVLHQTFMPSVLVETGFLTNDREGAYLNSKKGQSEMGKAIGEAIMAYRESAMANVADFNPVVTERDAGTASHQETAQITEEARRSSKSETRSKSETSSRSATRSKSETSSRSNQDPEEEVVGASSKVADDGEGRADTGKDRPDTGKDRSDTGKDHPDTGKDRSDTGKDHPAADISGIVYRVQIMASAKDFPLRPEFFNGLNRVTQEPYKDLYRYLYGSTSSLEEAEMLKSNADLKGYPSSFIVVYKDGDRTSFKESKEYISGQ